MKNFDMRGLASLLDDHRHGKPDEDTLRSVHVKPDTLLSVYDKPDEDSFRRRPDGSLVLGLTYSEWESYVEKYPSLSIEELTYFRDMLNIPRFDPLLFEGIARSRAAVKKKENRYGKPAYLATSLFMLLSVHVKPTSERNPFSVCGEIASDEGYYYKETYIYKTEVGSHSHDGNLILYAPFEGCQKEDACFILQSRKLSITLYDQQGQHLYPFDDDEDPIVLDYSPNEFEHVTRKVVQNSEISLTLNYVSIPMGVFGHLILGIFNKEVEEENTHLCQQIKVCGKVVATYKNTFGNYNSEEIVLFDKNPDKDGYETVDLGKGHPVLPLRRSWVAAPVFSLLHLRIHLYNFETKESIMEQDVELGTCGDSYEASKVFMYGGFFMTADLTWFTPTPRPEEIEDDDDNQIPRSLDPPQMEVFSVLICPQAKHNELQIHGRLQFRADYAMDFEEGGIDIFKQEKESPLSLLGRSNIILSTLDGSRLYENNSSLSMICDLEDTLGPLSIKGYRYCSELDSFGKKDSCLERRMCSIFRGDHGSAALHYSIFSRAMKVVLTVTYQKKEQKELEVVNSPTVSGSLYAQYADRDYSSKYTIDCYRIVLFKGTKALLQMDDYGLIPLSRSSFIVPSDSSAMFDLDLTIGNQKVSSKINVPIGIRIENIPSNEGEGEVKFELEWSEVK